MTELSNFSKYRSYYSKSKYGYYLKLYSTNTGNSTGSSYPTWNPEMNAFKLVICLPVTY